jgi:hypothetical protein
MKLDEEARGADVGSDCPKGKPRSRILFPFRPAAPQIARKPVDEVEYTRDSWGSNICHQGDLETPTMRGGSITVNAAAPCPTATYPFLSGLGISAAWIIGQWGRTSGLFWCGGPTKTSRT